MKFKYLANRSDFCFNFDSSYFKRLDSILKDTCKLITHIKAVIGKCSARQETHGLMAKNIELKFQ